MTDYSPLVLALTDHVRTPEGARNLRQTTWCGARQPSSASAKAEKARIATESKLVAALEAQDKKRAAQKK